MNFIDHTSTDELSVSKPSRSVVKRSIVIGGHKTSISLEEPFWTAVKEIADERRVTVKALVEQINRERHRANLSCATRLFVLDYYKSKVAS